MEESVAPYRKLEPPRRRFLWWLTACFSRRKQQKDEIRADDVVRQLDTAMDKMRMKILNLQFRVDRLEAQAKTQSGHMQKELMRQRAKLMGNSKVFTEFYGRLFDLKEQIENAATTQSLHLHMDSANAALKTMLDSLDLNKIEELMVELAMSTEKSQEVNNALAEDLQFDIEIDEEEICELPNVPEKAKDELPNNLNKKPRLYILPASY